jgi:phage baseplate assembly protein W
MSVKSISFPDMFGNASTNIVSGHAATEQNLRMLLLSERGSFLGDPYFGVRLRYYLFEQNSSVALDMLGDEIYTQIATFMPQLKVSRSDITVTPDTLRGRASVSIRATNMLNYETDMYNIVLLSGNEENS